MLIHVSYQFQVRNGPDNGFGDCIVDIDPPPRGQVSAVAWLTDLRNRLSSFMHEKTGIKGAGIVVIAWNVMDWGAIE